MSEPDLTERPRCCVCREPIAEARWHVRFGWVYFGHCDECHEPLCESVKCGESDINWHEGGYNRCLPCVARLAQGAADPVKEGE